MSHGQQQVLLPAYESNLEQLVQRLRQTGARLIWASTKPVPPSSPNLSRKPS